MIKSHTFMYYIYLLGVCSLSFYPGMSVAQSPEEVEVTPVVQTTSSRTSLLSEDVIDNDITVKDTLKNQASGIQQETPGKKITLFPNPAQDFFNIDGETVHLTIRIFDQNGRFYRQITHRDTPIRIDISSLPPGRYVVKIYDHKKDIFYSKTLVKK